MNKIKFIRLAGVSLAAIILISACRKRADVGLSDNLVVFTASEQGMTESENSIDVKLKLSRQTDKDVPVTITFTPTGLVYGTDFTTTPEAANGEVTVIVPSGNNEAKFTVNKVAGALFDGDEKIKFDIYRSESPLLIGSLKEFDLGFKELVANNATAKLDGGGATYPNKVFFDLSANRQTLVNRTAWDLGFYTHPDSFRVVINSSTTMMAKEINKNDLTQVTAADTTNFYLDLAYGAFGGPAGSMAFVDNPAGDLSKTAFKSIAASVADNKVYIVNRGNGVGTPAPHRGWKKVRVLRNASGGFTVQYADIAATTFSTIEVPKDNEYFFKYISFDNGLVNVEPKKTKWDIAWTYFANSFGTGPAEIPFMFQDIVLQNRNVQVAKVLAATRSYDAFTEADLAGITDWSTSQIKIGSDWRTTNPAGVPVDRYYIIKDGEGNYYKLKFTAITDGGIRGYPFVAYALVKRG